MNFELFVKDYSFWKNRKEAERKRERGYFCEGTQCTIDQRVKEFSEK